MTRRKGRTLLVVLGILIGVLGLTAINVAAGAMGAAFAYSQNQSASGDIEFYASKGVQPAAVLLLQAQPNVQTVQLLASYSTRWKVAQAPGHVNIGIVAFPDLNRITLGRFQLTSGHLPGPGEIVMETSDRALQGFAVGDTITVDSPNGPTTLTIVGTSRTLGRTSAALTGTARGYMNMAGLQQLAGVGAPNFIEIRLDDPSHAKATATALQAQLKAAGVRVDNVSLLSRNDDLGVLNGLFTVMRVLSLIALLLTSFLIINTVTTLVAEQTRIIGTMKAIGATRGRVMRGYLGSVAIYAVAGSALGIGLGIYGGYLLASYVADLITLDLGPFSLDPGVLALSLAVGIGIPILAALLPLWNGTRITVRAALSGYGVSAGNAGRTTRRARLLPPAIALGTRGVFRRPGRAALTLLALTLSATAFLAIQTTTYSANQFISHIFTQYNFDAFVGANPGPYAARRAQLLAVPNVAVVERFEQDELDTKWGTARVQGVEADTHLYHYDLVAGRWLRAGEPGTVVISEQMQQQTHLALGDTLTVNGVTTFATWRVIGVVRDLNGGLGTIGTAFTTIDTLHAFAGLPADEASSFMVQAADRSPAAVNRMATALDDTLSRAGLNPVVSTAQQQIARNQSEFNILYVLLYAVAVIVALVGVLGLFNTLTTSVLERRREIGILRSLGATGWRVASVFWVEGLSLAGVAWLVAVALGIPAAYGFVALIGNVLIQMPFAFDPTALALMLAFTFVLATVASAIPALSASRVRVADTLRYE
ncbi:MAG TPA: FtsX-like permease family protein [Ktedonobacterales bacterium]